MFQIIGQHNCVYCEYACNKLDELGVPYKYRQINKPLKRWFRKRGMRTVPQIWLDGAHIGGYEELIKHLEKANVQTTSLPNAWRWPAPDKCCLATKNITQTNRWRRMEWQTRGKSQTWQIIHAKKTGKCGRTMGAKVLTNQSRQKPDKPTTLSRDYPCNTCGEPAMVVEQGRFYSCPKCYLKKQGHKIKALDHGGYYP